MIGQLIFQHIPKNLFFDSSSPPRSPLNLFVFFAIASSADLAGLTYSVIIIKTKARVFVNICNQI